MKGIAWTLAILYGVAIYYFAAVGFAYTVLK